MNLVRLESTPAISITAHRFGNPDRTSEDVLLD